MAAIRETLAIPVTGDARRSVRVCRNTYFRDVIRDERYASARDIFAAVMLPKAENKPEYAKFGNTEQNPAVRRRMGYTLRQAVYFNPDCTEAVIQKTIAECNRILSEKEDKN